MQDILWGKIFVTYTELHTKNYMLFVLYCLLKLFISIPACNTETGLLPQV